MSGEKPTIVSSRIFCDSPIPKPDYVPDEGWFIDIKPNPLRCRIWHNGCPVSRVKSVKFEMSAETQLPKVELVIFPENIHVESPEAIVNTETVPSDN